MPIKNDRNQFCCHPKQNQDTPTVNSHHVSFSVSNAGEGQEVFDTIPCLLVQEWCTVAPPAFSEALHTLNLFSVFGLASNIMKEATLHAHVLAVFFNARF